MNKLVKFSLFCFLGFIYFGITGYSQNSQPFSKAALVLENDLVRLEFEPEHLGLSAMIDKITWVNHVQPVEGKQMLWELSLHRGTQENLLTNLREPSTSSRIENLTDGAQRAILEWRNINYWREENALNITVTIDLPKNSGVAQWRINVDNNSKIWGLWEVHFPYFSGFLESGKYDLAIPKLNWGYLYKNATEEYNTISYLPTGYPSGYWPMQFLAATKGTNSLFLGALDPDAWIKTYKIKSGEYFYFITYVEDMGVPGSDYPAPYAANIGVYQGDWFTACKMYRQWALKQLWTQQGPLSKRTEMPDAIKNLGLWMISSWDFGKYGAPDSKPDGKTPHDMNIPLLEAKKYFGVPVGLHWYNWHHNVFDNEYPHFLPPKSGFKERVTELVKNGLLIMPYINGLICDYDNPDFEKFRPAATKDEVGEVRTSVYGTTSGRMVPMCPTTELWQKAVVNLVDSLTGYYGLNAVYVDQVAASKPRPCFDPNHGHPLGGGGFWHKGYQTLMQKVQEVANQRKAVITTECTSENYMNVVDAFLSWMKPEDNEIPMLPAVYSGYTLYFSSPSNLEYGDRAFIMNQGRVFAWGCQNGWMDFELFQPEHKEKVAYLKQIGQYRVAAKKFLTFGELVDILKPVHPENIFTNLGSSNEFPVNNLGGTPAVIPTVTEKWPTQDNVVKDATLPAVIGAVWKSEDGHLGLFLTSFIDEKFDYTYRIVPQKYGIIAGQGEQFSITQIKPEGNKIIGYHYNGPVIRTERLGPREIRVLDIGVCKR